MVILDKTVVQLGNEGITIVDDLVHFDKDTMQQVAFSLQRPGGRIPYPTPNSAPVATIPTPPFVIGAKSRKRLFATCDIVRYYETTERGITTANVSWNTAINIFEAQWKVLKERKKGDKPDVPKIIKALPVIKWTQALGGYLNSITGHLAIPLSYVVRK